MKLNTPSLLASLALAHALACGTVTVEPIGAGPTTDAGAGTDSAVLDAGTPDSGPSIPPVPVGPYTGIVGTTDVSILYPLPIAGASTAFVRPAERGNHGDLFPRSMFERVMQDNNGRLDSFPSPLTAAWDTPSGYDQLALVSVRLDPCAARGSTCTSEIRLVFQALYEQPLTAPAPRGTAALDGAIHVTYDVPAEELVVALKQILTLKAANGGVADQVLGVHPILAAQGLGGPFASGLRQLILEHLGADRIARVTSFDHHNNDEDGWAFRNFVPENSGLRVQTIPPSNVNAAQFVVGSQAVSQDPLTTRATVDGVSVDDVSLLLAHSSPGAPALAAAFEAAVRVQNPATHTSETLECATCHLAEGAVRIGKGVHGLTTANAFTHPRNLGYTTQSTSVTNLHAFGYLERSISIMQRTANESVVVATAMEEKLK